MLDNFQHDITKAESKNSDWQVGVEELKWPARSVEPLQNKLKL